MALKGVKTYSIPNPLQRSSFRSSWMQPEGHAAPIITECVIVDVNLNRWTVDCLSKYDQHRYLNIQVASPYMHPNRGEGIYVTPDVGAKCYVCIPSDGPPPFVIAFMMPMEKVEFADANETAEGVSTEQSNATYAGGRPRPKLGDIAMRGRDGNFCVLHRGGVVEIGASAVAQRIYIPVGNIITDVSQNYRHYNTGGAVNWGVKFGPSEANPPTFYKHTFRLTADEAEATMRVAIGTFADVVAEPEDGRQSDIEQLEIGTDDQVVCEVVVAPETFNADTGDVTPDTPAASVFRFFFDKAGGTALRVEGSLLLAAKKKIRLVADDNIELFGKKDLLVNIDGSFKLTAGGGPAELTGETLTLNGGTKPVAHVGSLVNIILPAPIPVIGPGLPPGTAIAAGAVFQGQIISGNPTVLV